MTCGGHSAIPVTITFPFVFELEMLLREKLPLHVLCSSSALDSPLLCLFPPGAHERFPRQEGEGRTSYTEEQKAEKEHLETGNV